MATALPTIDEVLASIPEIKAYSMSTNNEKIDVTIILVKKDKRRRDSFKINEEIATGLSPLK